jgi:putative hydrolase of the HAD superfamily
MQQLLPELNKTTIKGIIFDLDGTLYQMHWYMRPLLTCKLFPHSLRLPRFLKIRNKFSGIEMISRENLMKSVCDELALIEKSTSSDMHSWIMNHFYPSFISIMSHFRNSRPDLNQILQTLKNNGYKMAVLSDYEKVDERLKRLEISSTVFDVLKSSELSGALKPASRPFLEIAANWNLPPESILVIGDRDDTDGRAARDANMPFVKVSNKNFPAQNIYNWKNLRNFLYKLKPVN